MNLVKGKSVIDFKVYTADDIQARIKRKVALVVEKYDLSEDDSMTLLRHYDWNFQKLEDRWIDAD